MCFAYRITEARMEIHTHNFISQDTNGDAKALQWYVTRPLPVFFFLEVIWIFRLFRWCIWRFRSSGLWRCVSVCVYPDGSSKHDVRIYNHFIPWKWKKYAVSKFKHQFTHRLRVINQQNGITHGLLLTLLKPHKCIT